MIWPMIELGGVISGRIPGGNIPGNGREPFLRDLAGVPDVGPPAELDIGDGQPLARLAADDLHAGGAEDGRLDRLGDQGTRPPRATGRDTRSA